MREKKYIYHAQQHTQQSQLSGRQRQEELKFKIFLGFKACLRNLVRPSLKIKIIKERRGCVLEVEYLTNMHERAQAMVSSIEIIQPKNYKVIRTEKYQPNY